MRVLAGCGDSDLEAARRRWPPSLQPDAPLRRARLRGPEPFLVLDVGEFTARCRACPWISPGAATVAEARAWFAAHRCQQAPTWPPLLRLRWPPPSWPRCGYAGAWSAPGSGCAATGQPAPGCHRRGCGPGCAPTGPAAGNAPRPKRPAGRGGGAADAAHDPPGSGLPGTAARPSPEPRPGRWPPHHRPGHPARRHHRGPTQLPRRPPDPGMAHLRR
jgi:hypothetical protein